MTKTYPGIHPNIKNNSNPLSDEEYAIVKILSKDFFITACGDFRLGSSNYNYVLIKPPQHYQKAFNLNREIVVIFSQYETFEPRTLDGFDYLYKRYQKLRLNKVCGVLLSRCPNIASEVNNLLTRDEESQIIIPFSYDELLAHKNDDFIIRNKFRKHFYTRDLFAFEGPLKKDWYFFGRHNLIQQLVNRHRSNENSGIFGLRKSGKTSVIYGVCRALDISKCANILIDCSNPSFHQRTWNSALEYVVIKLFEKYEVNAPNYDFSVENASDQFNNSIKRLLGSLHFQNLMIIFDEIEHISPATSSSKLWKDGYDFIYFWQTIRTVYQHSKTTITFLIAGTNPKCVETSNYNKIDNPLFGILKPVFIGQFNLEQTREMIRTLSKYMGLNFEEVLYSKLQEDFGGL